MKKWLFLFECGCAFAALWLVLLFCYYASPTSGRDLWDMATAIGTVGATVAAVWIALHQHGIKRQEDHTKAVLAAARIYWPVNQAIARLRPIEAWVVSVKTVDPTPSQSLSQLAKLEDIALDIDAQMLVALVPVANNCAYNLSSAMGQLDIAKSIARRLKGNFQVPQHRAKREKTAMVLEHIIGNCLALLEDAKKEFKKAAPGRITEG